MRCNPVLPLLLGVASLAAQSVPSILVQARPNDSVLLLLAAGPGPALRFAGVRGVLRLDLATLVVVPASAPDAFGRSETPIPWAAGLPPAALHCQAAVVGSGIFVSRAFQPLLDAEVDAVDQALPLGPAGPQGPFLFGLTRQQILDTLRAYGSDPGEDARVLHDLRRPFRRASRPGLVEDVGLENALRLEHETWLRLLRRDPRPAIESALDALTDQREDEYFVARFPQGIPETSDFFDYDGSGLFAAVTVCDGETTKTSGDYRLKLTVKLKSTLGVSYTGKATAKAYHKTWYGLWLADSVDTIHVEGTLSVGLLTCDFARTETHDNKAKDKCSLVAVGTAAVNASAYADWGTSGPRLSANACDD